MFLIELNTIVFLDKSASKLRNSPSEVNEYMVEFNRFIAMMFGLSNSYAWFISMNDFLALM